MLRGGGARLGAGLGVGQGGEGRCSTTGGGGARRGSYGSGGCGNPGKYSLFSAARQGEAQGSIGVGGAPACASSVVPTSYLRGWPFRVERLLAGLGAPPALHYCLSRSPGDLVSRARQERDKVAWAWDTLVRNCDASFERWEEQDWELGRLRALLAQEQVVRPAGIPVFTTPSEQEVKELARGLRQSDELEVHQREWLLRKVTAVCLEVLGWAREHRLLVNSMSLGVSDVEEELSEQEVTPGLTRGVGRLSRLMGAHWHRTFIEAGSWMEAFVDRLQTPPSAEEMIQAAQDSLEAEFGPRGGQGEWQEGREGGD
ncbi:hypothetical protein C0992_008748 [Termitomyces sp. T32_za158]|nr:hypothetical protein C0992_008748 [Termitomyces sp. T32_za158]